MPFDITNYLKGVQADDTTKAQAWEVYNNSANQKDFESKLGGLGLPQNAKADLWESKFGAGAGAAPAPQPVQASTPPPAQQAQAAPQQGMLSKLWGWANAPATANVKSNIDAAERKSQTPTLADAEDYAKHPILHSIKSGTEAFADEFSAGAAKMFLTPLGLATAALGPVGKVAGPIGTAARTLETVTGVGFGAHGAIDAATNPRQPGESGLDYTGRLSGDVAGVVMGGLATGHAVSGMRKAAPVAPEAQPAPAPVEAAPAPSPAAAPPAPAPPTIHVDPAFANEMEAWKNDPDIQNKRVVLRTNKAGQQQVSLMSHDGKVPRFAQTQASNAVLPEGQGEPITLSQTDAAGKRATAKPGQFLDFQRPNKPAETAPTAVQPPAPAAPTPEVASVATPEAPIPAPETPLPAAAAPSEVLPQPEAPVDSPTASPAIPEVGAHPDYDAMAREVGPDGLTNMQRATQQAALDPSRPPEGFLPHSPSEQDMIAEQEGRPYDPAKDAGKFRRTFKTQATPEEGLGPGVQPPADVSPLEDKIRPLVGQAMRLSQLRQGEAVSHDIDTGINETNSMTGSIPSDVRGRLSNLLNEPIGDNLTPAQQARLEQMRGAQGSTTPVLKYAGKIADQEIGKDPDAWQRRLDASTIAMTQALKDPSTPPELQAKLMKALTTVDPKTGESKPYLYESDTLQYPRPQDLPSDHPEAPFSKQALGHDITPISLENYRAATGNTPRNLYNNPLGRKNYATPEELAHLQSLKESVQTNGFNPDLLQDMLGVRGEDSEETTGTGRVMQARGSYSPEFEKANRDLQQKVLARAHADTINQLKTQVGEWNKQRGQASTPLTEQLARLPDSARQHLPDELFAYEKSSSPEASPVTSTGSDEQPAQAAKSTKATRPAVTPGRPTETEGISTTKLDVDFAKKFPDEYRNSDLIRQAIGQRYPDDIGGRQLQYTNALDTYKAGIKADDPYALRKALESVMHNPEAGYIDFTGRGTGPLSPDQAHLANFDAAHNILTRYEAMNPAELFRTQKALRADTLARRIEAVSPVSNDPIIGAMQEDNYQYIKGRHDALVDQLPPSQNLWTGLTETARRMFGNSDERNQIWLREQLGQRNHMAAQMKSQLEGVSDFFTKVLNPADNDRFIDAMERGETFDEGHLANLDQDALAKWKKQYGDVPDFNQLGTTLRGLLDDARDRVQKTGNLQDYMVDYFPHMWDNVVAGQRIARDFTQSRTFMGNSDFLKQRTYEYRNEGLRQGLQPKTNNAVEDTINQVVGMNHFVMTHDYLNKLVDNQQAQFFEAGKAIPEGWKPIQVNGRAMGNGEYAAPASVAETFNNFTSKGLTGKWTLPGTDVSLYDKLRHANGMNNMFQLGFSAFHATETLLNSAFTAQSVGLKGALQSGLKGDLAGVGKSLLTAAKGYSFIAPVFEDAWNGSKGLTAWKNAAGEDKFLQLASDLEQANANVRTDPTFKIEQIQKMKDNWKDATDDRMDNGTRGWAAVKAGGNLMASTVEAVSAPLMNYLIPRVKVGAFYRMADQIHEQFGDQHPDVVSGELQKAWDSIDNRFGQVNYDNLFMNRTLKDSMALLMRSPGWNIGTFREVGGGVKDLVGSVKDSAQGKGFQISNRTAYTAAMVTGTMLINSVYQYMHTGQMPTGVDYFFPKDGTKTAAGEDNRVYPKTYVYDAINFAHAPVTTVWHKAAPPISTLSDLINNQDYYHREIRDPGASFGQNVASTLGFMAKQFLPFSVGNWQEAQMRGQKESIGGGLGILPAPRWAGRTAAENLAFNYFSNTQATGPEDPVSLERKENFVKMRNQLTSGQLTDDDIQKALEEGKITPKTVAHLYDSKNNPNLVTWVNRLTSPEQVMNVWNAANDSEKQMLLPHLYSKIANETSGQEQEDYLNKLQEFADQMDKGGNPPGQ